MSILGNARDRLTKSGILKRPERDKHNMFYSNLPGTQAHSFLADQYGWQSPTDIYGNPIDYTGTDNRPPVVQPQPDPNDPIEPMKCPPGYQLNAEGTSCLKIDKEEDIFQSGKAQPIEGYYFNGKRYDVNENTGRVPDGAKFMGDDGKWYVAGQDVGTAIVTAFLKDRSKKYSETFNNLKSIASNPLDFLGDFANSLRSGPYDPLDTQITTDNYTNPITVEESTDRSNWTTDQLIAQKQAADNALLAREQQLKDTRDQERANRDDKAGTPSTSINTGGGDYLRDDRDTSKGTPFRNQGGYINQGGFPGEPRGTDTVPTWLTSGEYVTNKPATEIFGDKIEQYNNVGRMVQDPNVTVQGGEWEAIHELDALINKYSGV